MTQAEPNLVASPDETLLAEVAQQNPEALEVLYQRHASGVLGLILRIVRNPTIADDLLQETFWQVWLKGGKCSGTGTVAWVYRTAREQAVAYLRRQPASPSIDGQSIDAGYLRSMALPPDAVKLSPTQPALAQIPSLAQIPEEQRICLELAYFQGMTQEQIAQHTRMPLGAVRAQLRIGLEKLEKLLRAAG